MRNRKPTPALNAKPTLLDGARSDPHHAAVGSTLPRGTADVTPRVLQPSHNKNRNTG